LCSIILVLVQDKLHQVALKQYQALHYDFFASSSD
jgi:hypothetical protein